MKNFVAVGNTLTITAGADIPSGGGVVAGTIFGVAADAIASGAIGQIDVTGIFDLPKIGSQAWAVGAAVHWDVSNSRCTTVAAGNRLIGCGVAAVGSTAGETTGRVRLNGIAGLGNAVAAAS